MLEQFKEYLAKKEQRATTTIYHYSLAVQDYIRWFEETYGHKPIKLFAENIMEYKVYLTKVKEQNAKTVNFKLAALKKYNEFLVEQSIQSDVVINKQMLMKIQREYASPATFGIEEVNRLRQAALEHGNKRDYALINLLAFAGLRISEALNLKLSDVHFETRELVVREGKGNKARTVLMSDRVIHPLRDYLTNERHRFSQAKNSPYLFVSMLRPQLDRMTVNKAFRKYNRLADVSGVNPHQLRHFFCSYLLENGFNVHEVAHMAGHSNVHTTLLYTNPNRKAILEKLDGL